MAVTAADVKQLRDRTSVGMMACRKALEEANGDMDQAIEILRKRGEAKAGDKADRSTGEGRIAIHENFMVKVMCETDFVAMNEQFVDFVQEVASKGNGATEYFESVKTDKIQAIGENLVLGDITEIEGNVVAGYVHSNGKVAALVALDGGTEEQARDVAMHVTAMNPSVANPSDMPSEELEKEKTIAIEQLKAEGKPENIIDKIVEGKLNKFAAERALTSQPFVKDGGMTVQEYLGDTKVLSFVRTQI